MWIRIALRTVVRVLASDRAALIAENLALRHQLAILQHKAGRVRLRRSDRIFWVWLSRLWSGWRSALVVVQPDTVVRWQREGSSSTGDGRAGHDRTADLPWDETFDGSSAA